MKMLRPNLQEPNPVFCANFHSLAASVGRDLKQAMPGSAPAGWVGGEGSLWLTFQSGQEDKISANETNDRSSVVKWVILCFRDRDSGSRIPLGPPTVGFLLH